LGYRPAKTGVTAYMQRSEMRPCELDGANGMRS
jgi:hypothetical protein